jgi:hypothetical protein
MTTHRGRPPSPRAAATRLARPPRAASQRRSAPRPGLPGRAAGTRGRRTQPGQAASDSPLTNARPRQRRPPQACSAVDRAARRRGSPPGPRPGPVVTGAPPHRPGPQRHRPMWEETDASGRTGGHQTGWTPDGWTLDWWTPDGWTLDGWTPAVRTAGPRTTTQVTGHRTGWTPDGLDCRIPDDGTGWMDSAWWTRTGDRRRGRRPGIAGRGDDGRPLDAGRMLRRAGAVWASNNQDRSAARTTRTGLATAATVSCR